VPYLKCVPCRIRVSATGALKDLAPGACPGCGSALEPVAELIEVMGFRSPDRLDPSVAPIVADPVTDISGGRSVARAELEVDRWLDEGGSGGLDPLADEVALDLRSHGWVSSPDAH
jgi:hypothetical protein